MFLLPDLVRTVVGLCFKIHEEGGSLLDDGQYTESVKFELNGRGLKFRENELIELEYLGRIVDKHLVEFIIEDKILLDTKGRMLLKHPVFYKQISSYLIKENLPLALIIDFHSRRLALRKVINPNYNYQM